MPDHLPVMLKLEGVRCVIVGGGQVARRRAEALLACGAQVTVIAVKVDEALAALPVKLERRGYQAGDVAGARLVVTATDEPTINDRVAREAVAHRALINRADNPDAGDLTIPAHAHHGPVTIAVHTAGRSPQAAAAIRRQLSDALDPDWPRLLEAVAGFREQIQAAFPDADERHARLRRLTDDDAMAILKAKGDDALREHCRAIAQPGQ